MTTEIIIYEYNEEDDNFDLSKNIDNNYKDACSSFSFRRNAN